MIIKNIPEIKRRYNPFCSDFLKKRPSRKFIYLVLLLYLNYKTIIPKNLKKAIGYNDDFTRYEIVKFYTFITCVLFQSTKRI